MKCYECIHRLDADFSAQSKCNHPSLGGNNRILFCHPLSRALCAITVVTNLHGVSHGWCEWPVDFDPVWIVSCTGFEKRKEASDEKNGMPESEGGENPVPNGAEREQVGKTTTTS
jgi:hypothetical protein